MCLCVSLRLLKTQSLEWFYTNVKSRFKRFGSAKVLKTLYRKHLLEHSTLTELTGASLSHSLGGFGGFAQHLERSDLTTPLFAYVHLLDAPPQSSAILVV